MTDPNLGSEQHLRELSKSAQAALDAMTEASKSLPAIEAAAKAAVDALAERSRSLPAIQAAVEAWAERSRSLPAIEAATKAAVDALAERSRSLPAMEAMMKVSVEAWGERVRTTTLTPGDLERMRAAVQNYGAHAVKERLLQTTLLRNSATQRARLALHELKGEGLIESGSFERAMKLVDVLFTPNTVYASIAPDDGGVTFYWRGGDMSVEIDIYPGEGYWWRVKDVAAESYSGDGAGLPLERLKYSLNWFSKDVERENPHWRQQTI